jgi:hypothetical protein
VLAVCRAAHYDPVVVNLRVCRIGVGGMKRKILLAAGTVAVLLAAAAAVFALHGGTATRTGSGTTGGNIPFSALASVRLLVSPHGRQALTPELDAFLPKGQMFPPGTTFSPAPGSWHQAGAYANVTGLLRVPGQTPAVAEIGLVNRAGRWLVTFEARR